ncbi:hypothetical protein GCM10023115_17980 [Pontixanthobacter gangjinensis]|uniref:Uncharacterized protein n=1 Tax=Pontixanthobacter gangjinensis TaxID=1028742 RepID=A0A6I4SMP4_9SPHN|nr:hypothetical protein [Pontixanthobacter gangjinensis]MXO57045.1 hypothetical protein [Pontixanthobacter gangjinensis]
MTQNDQQTSAESGEQKLARRKRSFWSFVLLGTVIAGVAGFASGFVTSRVEQGLISEWAIYPILAVTIIGFIWFSYLYYMRIDELDLMDNLWGNTIGMYAYVIITTSWMLFEQAGITGAPQHWPILTATVAISLIAYTARRLGLR